MLNIPDDYKNIREYYLAESQRIVNRYTSPVVLKTDLFNEERARPREFGIAGNLPGAQEVYAIEYNEQTFVKAKEIFAGRQQVFFLQGDIRFLSYGDKKFDVVLDLSTIDHVLPADMPRVIAGYARVLRDGGRLLLISWIDKEFKDEPIVEYSPATQYYHSRDRIMEELDNYFDVEMEMALAVESNHNKVLMQFTAVKRPREA